MEVTIWLQNFTLLTHEIFQMLHSAVLSFLWEKHIH